MSKIDIWMPIYIGDYLRDTVELNAEEHGAYLLLLMHYWQKSGEIGCDIARLSRVAHASEEASRFILETYFTLEGENYKNKRADEEIGAAESRRVASSENGKKGGRPLKNNLEKTHSFSGGNLDETYGEPRSNLQESSSSSSSSSSLPSSAQAQEARACPDNFLKNVYEAWMNQEALPRLPAFLGFSLSEQARRAMAAWRGNHSDDIIAAVRNYGTMAASPRDYWPKTRPGMAGFFEGELFLKCLPANFPASCYTEKKKQAMKWEAGIAKAKRDAEEAGARE